MGGLLKTRRKYWAFFISVIFFHVPADVTITTIITNTYSVQNEANPFMRHLLQENWFLFAGSNLLAGLIAAVFFYYILMAGDDLDRFKKPYFLFVEFTLSILLLFGVFVFLNNLSIVLFAQNLFGFI